VLANSDHSFFFLFILVYLEQLNRPDYYLLPICAFSPWQLFDWITFIFSSKSFFGVSLYLFEFADWYRGNTTASSRRWRGTTLSVSGYMDDKKERYIFMPVSGYRDDKKRKVYLHVGKRV
jgi:hypothetical protein